MADVEHQSADLELRADGGETNSARSSDTRLPWVDFLRAAAAFLVVIVHSQDVWVLSYGKVSWANWETASLANSVSRIAVPIFCMVSGFLLLAKPIELTSFFKRRISRLLIPWLAWSLVFLFYSRYHDGAAISIRRSIVLLYSDNVYYHLWFLYMLAGMYLCMPILQWLVITAERSVRNYFLVGWIVTASLCPAFAWVMQSFFHQGWVLGIALPLFAGYSGYFLLGKILGEQECPRGISIKSGAVFALAVISLAVTSSIASARAGHFAGYNGYLSPLVILSSVAAFIWLKALGTRICIVPIIHRMVTRLSLASLGIYLVHPMLVDFFKAVFRRMPALISEVAAVNILLVTVCSFVSSFLIVSLIMRVPFLRRIVL
ncbi:MAG: acyltransferase family protein [Armatimonadota bacterium]